MGNDDELDRILTAALDEPPLPDCGFTSHVSARVLRYRRRRRVAVGVALVCALLLTGVGLALSPGAFEFPALSAQEIVLALVLTAVCCVVWIGTESRGSAVRV